MRALVLILSLLGSVAAHSAAINPQSVTNTPMNSDYVDNTKNAPFAVGDDGRLHRLRSTNSGELYTSGGGGGGGGSLTITGATVALSTTSITTIGLVVDETGVTRTVKTAKADYEPAIVGAQTIVAAVASRRIRVLNYNVSSASAQTIFFVDGAGSGLSNKGYGVVGGQDSAPTGGYLFQSGVGQSLRLNTSAAVNTSVEVVYVEVP